MLLNIPVQGIDLALAMGIKFHRSRHQCLCGMDMVTSSALRQPGRRAHLPWCDVPRRPGRLGEVACHRRAHLLRSHAAMERHELLAVEHEQAAMKEVQAPYSGSRKF